MGSEHITPITIIILLVFAIMAVIAIGAVIVGFAHMFVSVIPQSLVERVHDLRDDAQDWWRKVTAKLPWHDDIEDDDEDHDDLNAQATRLLAMLPMVAVLTDETGSVLRANPQAYQFGIVDEDTIVNPEIAQAVAAVRHSGGSTTLQVVTQTPKRYEHASEEATGFDGADADSADADSADDSAVSIEVSRRNWLDITVGSLGSGLVAVLIRDTSAARRFARVQEDFVSNVSARLLEPMRALQRLGDDLTQDDVDIDQLMASASRVHDYASVTAHILDDLLLLIQAQTPIDDQHGELVDLNDIVRDAVGDMQAMAQHAAVGVRVRYSEPITVVVDRHQVEAAVACLLANGIIYSPSGSTVDVVIDTTDGTVGARSVGEYAGADARGRVDARGGAARGGAQGHVRMARVRVIDRGVGIEAEDLPRIFRRFYRGSLQPRWPGRVDIEHGGASGGVGLGLAIVKHVALTHQGTAIAWSRPGSGSTFTLTLPMA